MPEIQFPELCIILHHYKLKKYRKMRVSSQEEFKGPAHIQLAEINIQQVQYLQSQSTLLL